MLFLQVSMRQTFPVGETAVLFSYSILKDVIWRHTVGQRLTLDAAGKCFWVQAREQDGGFCLSNQELTFPTPRSFTETKLVGSLLSVSWTPTRSHLPPTWFPRPLPPTKDYLASTSCINFPLLNFE